MTIMYRVTNKPVGNGTDLDKIDTMEDGKKTIIYVGKYIFRTVDGKNLYRICSTTIERKKKTKTFFKQKMVKV